MADDLAAKHEQQHDIDSAKAEEIRAESQKLWEARKVFMPVRVLETLLILT
jgi:hypothetical protein